MKRRAVLTILGASVLPLTGCFDRGPSATRPSDMETQTRSGRAVTPMQTTPDPTEPPTDGVDGDADDDNAVTFRIELENADETAHRINALITHRWWKRCKYVEATENDEQRCYHLNNHGLALNEVYDIAPGELVTSSTTAALRGGRINVNVVSFAHHDEQTDYSIRGIEQGVDEMLDNPERYAFRFADSTRVTIHAQITDAGRIQLAATSETGRGY